MRDSELRGIIVRALYNQRRSDLVSFDQELGGLPVPDGATESILRQLQKKGLIERPVQALSGLGSGRITQAGIDVIEGKRKPPVSIIFQNATSSNLELGSASTQKDSILESDVAVDRFQGSVAMDHSYESEEKSTAPIGWMRKWVMDMLKKFGSG
jgi:hypothetical protein